MGPGPSDIHPRVLNAIGKGTVGHLDPYYLETMNNLQEMLRKVFKTENELTMAISATGSAGMETTVVNLIEPGDKMLVCINGVFGMRMADLAIRCGANVMKVEAPWGEIIRPEQVKEAVAGKSPKLIALVHAETSTGALTPAEEISKIAHDAGALMLLDTVTSLGGCEVDIDGWSIDAVYSGTQKCLSCPPGLAPVSLSPKALKIANNRKTQVQSWYLDVNLLSGYWGTERVYHHTAPISMNYALHESLRLVLEEGLQTRWARHKANHEKLAAGLKKLGLGIASQEGHQLWQLNAVTVPEETDEAQVRKRLLEEYQIEVGAGLGPMKGKIWRVGLMGESSTAENVDRYLDAMTQILAH